MMLLNPVPVAEFENARLLVLVGFTVNVTEVVWEAGPFSETVSATSKLLPIIKLVGATRPDAWTITLSDPPTAGFVNPLGCVTVTEPVPVFVLFAVNVVVALLVPPLNVTEAGDTLPRLDGATTRGTLTE